MEESVIQRVRKHIEDQHKVATSVIDQFDENLEARPSLDYHFWRSFLLQPAADYAYTKKWAAEHYLLLEGDFDEIEWVFYAWFAGSTLNKFIVAAIATELAELRRFHDQLDVVDMIAGARGEDNTEYPARQPELSITSIAQKAIALLPAQSLREILAQLPKDRVDS